MNIQTNKSKKGFSLVEILIILSVICILSAIIFSTFSRVRERAHRSTCQSNLRQIGMALQQYVSDNSGAYPFWFNESLPGNPPPNSYPGIGWSVRIQDYLKNVDLLQCPSDFRYGTKNPNLGASSNDPAYTDYSYNLLMSGLLESKLSIPTRTVVVSDYIPGAAWNIFGELSDEGRITGFLGNSNRHSGWKNCLFVDGHVKWMRPEFILDGSNSSLDPRCALTVYPATTCIY
ncbi:hypothetical protein B1R32_13025 [Abditibacterium utsteinense]|uniref:DUF1559 domain-containing protein n=1 Tax=Abditibacterium utsteinense TaxID=1960156 RepID=A0A2S8SP19_9BACT|nr:prepilin-type N-terminal cleavage/methylation domain-containing protein [Abditibacterium utsteinense]PQV62538.1 hypothetical protein B1R32_13025 [Abditibacterium utsteinense]